MNGYQNKKNRKKTERRSLDGWKQEGRKEGREDEQTNEPTNNPRQTVKKGGRGREGRRGTQEERKKGRRREG